MYIAGLDGSIYDSEYIWKYPAKWNITIQNSLFTVFGELIHQKERKVSQKYITTAL